MSESELGPLAAFVGEWEGDTGVDLSYHYGAGSIYETPYHEKAWFKPIPVTENGKQTITGLKYEMTAWPHGDPVPFHNEVGYLLWDQARGLVMRSVVFGRGIAILAGSLAKPSDLTLRFDADPGKPDFSILQNPHLLEKAQIKSFRSSFTVIKDGSFSYESSLVLALDAIGREMHHTDRNTLHRTSA